MIKTNSNKSISFNSKLRKSSAFLLLTITMLAISLENNIPNLINNANSIGFSVDGTPIAEITIPIDLVFTGYVEDYIDIISLNTSLEDEAYYYGVDSIWNEEYQRYDSLLDLEITFNYTYHFTDSTYETNLNSFIDSNSWNGTTSALNTTALNLQESSGERQSIFYEQEGKAIDGEALESYLDSNPGFTASEPSYIIHILNQSRFDTSNHSFEHWFEIDITDPDSNITADWWRLEWDNDLNTDVEFPYPCWGSQNRNFFLDPYSHQWYTKWTDIWWNADYNENEFDYLTVDLDTYLGNNVTGSVDYITHLTNYLADYLNDIIPDVGGRGDGLLYNEREISAQTLFINNETQHGYSQEDLEWIYHDAIIDDAFNYVVPDEVANITLETSWVELSEDSVLNDIINNNILGEAQLGSYPWYNENWTYLDGINIFYDFQDVADSYFNTSKGDSVFTDWVILLQNISMIGYSYGEYREYTGLGGGGNVVCYKDLNRYYQSDGSTPRSGLTSLLIHEIGHVIGFQHAEIFNDAVEGAGGFIDDVMSYYTIGAYEFSIFLKDSLYRTSSFVNYFRNRPLIESYRSDPLHNETILAAIDQVVSDGSQELSEMDYVEAFILFRSLYDLTAYLPRINPSFTSTAGLSISLITVAVFVILFNERRTKRRIQ